jgi:hypothetical protein
LHLPGEEIKQVYFPHSGIVAASRWARKSTSTATAGRLRTYAASSRRSALSARPVT